VLQIISSSFRQLQASRPTLNQAAIEDEKMKKMKAVLLLVAPTAATKAAFALTRRR